MKTKDIAAQYGVGREEFENFLRREGKPGVKDGLMGMTVDDSADINGLVNECKAYLAQEKAEEEQAEQKRREREEEKRRKEDEARAAEAKAVAERKTAMANMLISSGFTFEGYSITKYSGYISGDDAISVDRGTQGFFSSATHVGASLMDSLKRMRRVALQELKEAAYDLGCNAIIGVDFDYITLEPETANSSGGTTYLPYVFGVTANGNAVIIEKM